MSCLNGPSRRDQYARSAARWLTRSRTSLGFGSAILTWLRGFLGPYFQIDSTQISSRVFS